MCFAVNNRLHMDRTTSWVLCSGLADCYRQLERIPEIATRTEMCGADRCAEVDASRNEGLLKNRPVGIADGRPTKPLGS